MGYVLDNSITISVLNCLIVLGKVFLEDVYCDI